MSETDQQARKEWSQPMLATYGTIEDITRGCDPKQHGLSDAYAVKAPPIHCAS